MTLLLDDVQFNRIDDAALGSQPDDGPFNFHCVTGELHIRPPCGVANIGSSDIGHDVIFAPDLIDNRLSNLVFRKTNMEAQMCHGYPPAIAGTMETSSPSLREVSFPLRKRMSSSLT